MQRVGWGADGGSSRRGNKGVATGCGGPGVDGRDNGGDV